jgi:hypothetical protein
MQSASPPNFKYGNSGNGVSDKISDIKLAYLAQGGQDLEVLAKIQRLETLSAA